MTETIDGIDNAWSKAETQLCEYFAKVTGFKPGENFFVGDDVDLLGRVNMAVVWIQGGGEQSQGMQSGCNVWHVPGHIHAVFSTRAAAKDFCSKIIKQENMPFEGGPETDLPNIVKVYMPNHPTATRELRVLANKKSKEWCCVVDVEIAVVYQALQDGGGAISGH